LLVRAGLGTLLIAAAIMKAYGLNSDASPVESPFSSPRLQVATIQAELILGLWLLGGYWLPFAWRAAILLFAAFSGASVYLALIGQRSCGCFGKVEISPWITAAFDIFAVGALLSTRPALPARIYGFWKNDPLRLGAGLVLLLSLASVAPLTYSQDFADGLGRIRGEMIRVEPSVTWLDAGAAGETREFTVRVHNASDRTVRVVGGTTTCQCETAFDLPITLDPKQTSSVRIRATLRGSPGTFQQRFDLMVDHPEQRWVVGRFAGIVSRSPTSGD
jgi:hypothetical protein